MPRRRLSRVCLLTRKALFREAALARVPILKQIASALEAKADHAMPLEFFRDVLEEHFSEDEAKRQMETVLNWGRYAEIFVYDSEDARVALPGHIASPHPAEDAVQP